MPFLSFLVFLSYGIKRFFKQRREENMTKKIYFFPLKEKKNCRTLSSWRTLDINLRRLSFRDAFEIFMKVQFPLFLVSKDFFVWWLKKKELFLSYTTCIIEQSSLDNLHDKLCKKKLLLFLVCEMITKQINNTRSSKNMKLVTCLLQYLMLVLNSTVE